MHFRVHLALWPISWLFCADCFSPSLFNAISRPTCYSIASNGISAPLFHGRKLVSPSRTIFMNTEKSPSQLTEKKYDVGPTELSTVLSDHNTLHDGAAKIVESPLLIFRGSELQKSLEMFETVDDQIMGGISQSTLKAGTVRDADSGADECAVFSGVVRVEGGGFVSNRMKLLAEPLDLSAYTGLYLKVRGDGKVYKLNLRTGPPRAPKGTLLLTPRRLRRCRPRRAQRKRTTRWCTRPNSSRHPTRSPPYGMRARVRARRGANLDSPPPPRRPPPHLPPPPPHPTPAPRGCADPARRKPPPRAGARPAAVSARS